MTRWIAALACTLPLSNAAAGEWPLHGLDPGNQVLWDRYNPLVRQYVEERAPPPDVLARDGALAPDDARIAAVLEALRACRDAGAPRGTVLARMRAALALEGSAR